MVDDGNAKTLVSLRDYLERRLEDHDRMDTAHFRALEEATRKAAEIMDIRLANMNEFRDSLRDQTARYVRIEQIDQANKRWDEQLDDINRRLMNLEIRLSNLDGRLAAYGAALAIFLAALSIALRFMP